MLWGRGVQSQEWEIQLQGKSPNIPNTDLSDILSCPIRGAVRSCYIWPDAVAKCQGARRQVQALLLLCCVTLGKVLPFSGPHYSLL